MKNSSLATRLEAHLDAEYAALIEGDIDKVEAFAADKLAMLETIPDLTPDQIKPIETLREKLVRNQLLTLSAIEGMRHAITRARAVHDVATSLRTYNAKGQQQAHAITKSKTLSTRS